MAPACGALRCQECGGRNDDLTSDFCLVCGPPYPEWESPPDTSSIFSSLRSSRRVTTVNRPVAISITTAVKPENHGDAFPLEVVKLLWDMPMLRDLYLEGYNQGATGRDRLARKFRRLIRQLGLDLRLEASTSQHHLGVRFLWQNSKDIAELVRKKADASVSSMTRLKLVQTSPKTYALDLGSDLNREEDSSNDEDATEKSWLPVEDSKYIDLNSDEFKGFIKTSQAMLNLYAHLHDHVRPTVLSQISEYIGRKEKIRIEGLLHDDETESWLTAARFLRNELRDVACPTLTYEKVSRFSWISNFTTSVERVTGEKWDWWPLRPVRHHQKDSDCARLRWNCICGEDRWEYLPKSFVQAVVELSQQLASTGPGTIASNIAVPQASTTLASIDSNNSQNPPVPLAVPSQNRQSSNSGLQTGTSNVHNAVPRLAVDEGSVLVIVRAGGEFRLTQINVKGISTQRFFDLLRTEYFKLRGFVGRYLSVWCFSHCDFYKFEKYDERSFAPKQRDQYPDPSDADYDYDPKSVHIIPPVPITPHEFKKRFYSNAASGFHLRCYKNCSCAKFRRRQVHNCERLELLPKRRSRLDVSSEQPEPFWGLYAREEISFFRVIIYNAICILPFLWLMLMWIFHWGQDGDLQNASVPLMAMLSLLSIFWTSFIANLSFDKNADH